MSGKQLTEYPLLVAVTGLARVPLCEHREDGNWLAVSLFLALSISNFWLSKVEASRKHMEWDVCWFDLASWKLLGLLCLFPGEMETRLYLLCPSDPLIGQEWLNADPWYSTSVSRNDLLIFTSLDLDRGSSWHGKAKGFMGNYTHIKKNLPDQLVIRD